MTDGEKPESGEGAGHTSARDLDPEQSLDMLVEFTKDDDPRTRATAVAALAKVRAPRGFGPVLVTLFDPVDEVRAAAATALGIYGDLRAYEPLVQGLEDPNVNVAANCVWSMGQLADPRCLDKILEVLGDDGKALQLRRAAATALGERSSLAGSDLATDDGAIERSRLALLRTLRSDDGELRASSAWTLGHFPAEERTNEALVELLDDGYAWAVKYAVEALAHVGGASAVEPLEGLARGDDQELAELARKALDMLDRGEERA